MRTAIVFFLIVIIAGCQSEEKVIYGAWRTLGDPKYERENLIDSFVFERPDTLRIFYLQDSKVVETIVGNFKWNPADSSLVTSYNGADTKFKVQELTATSLVARNAETNDVMKAKRLK